jgi:hypothetical protein
MDLTLDTQALEQARADLGLSLDVHVHFDKLTPRHAKKGVVIQGRYTGTDCFHNFHAIWIHKHLTVAAANGALWHELTHAQQCERVGSYARFDAEYRRQQRAVPAAYPEPEYFRIYRDHMPFEHEAWAATDLAEAGILALLVRRD